MRPYICLRESADIENALEQFLEAPLIAIDTETTGLDPHSAKLLLIQIDNGLSTLVIDMLADHDLSLKNKASKSWQTMIQLLTNSSLKIGHNIGFDFKILKAFFNVDMCPMFCTMIAERMLTSGKDIMNKYPSLKSIVPKYTSLTEKDMKKEVRGTFYKGYVLNDFTEDQLEYGARDVQVLLPIYWKQLHQLHNDNMVRVANLEFSVIAPIALMEYHGININIDHWHNMLTEIEAERVKLKGEIQQFLKPLEKQQGLFANFCSISIDSPAQLLVALQDLGIQIDSTGKNVLDKLKGNHPIIKPLLRYRTLNKLMTSYGDGLLAKIHPKTGRLHGNFRQIGADTSRTSSSDPNLQNIPGASKFRLGFVAPEGYDCISADYSGQELRVLAYLSNDNNMQIAFKEGKDLHTLTAAGIFGISYDKFTEILDSLDVKKNEGRFSDITPEEESYKKKRAISKSSNFLVSYGGSYKRLAATADIPEEDAQKIINGYFKIYPDVKSYMKVEGDKAVALGYSLTAMGGRRYYTLPPTSDPDYHKVDAAVRRQAVNHTIQGTSANMSKLALYYAHAEFTKQFGEDVYIWAIVHDEICVCSKKEYTEKAAKILVESMERAFYDIIPPSVVPCKVDVKVGSSWVH